MKWTLNTEHHQNCRRKRIPFIKSVQCYLFSNQQTHDRATISHIMHTCFPVERKKEKKKHETMKRWKKEHFFFHLSISCAGCEMLRSVEDFNTHHHHCVLSSWFFSVRIWKITTTTPTINIQCIQGVERKAEAKPEKKSYILFIIRQSDIRIKDNTHWKSVLTRKIEKKPNCYSPNSIRHQSTKTKQNNTKQNINDIRMIKWIFYFGFGALLQFSERIERFQIHTV